MSKKRILIVSHNLRIGGAERSLIGLLNSIDYELYDVDLFLYYHDGELLPLVPPQVNILPESRRYASILMGARDILRLGFIDILLVKVWAHMKARQYCRKHKIQGDHLVYLNYLHRYLLPFMPRISRKEYDLGVSFLTPHYFCAAKANSKALIAWIHTDYSHVKFDEQAEIEMWNPYNRIAAISKESAEVFNSNFPTLANKVVVIENILHPESIRDQVRQMDVSREIWKKPGQWILCSVGRFGYPKNFDNVPSICKYILNQGIDIKWYLIGYGGDEELIRDNIRKEGVEDHVIILGKKENPYPYINACDIYVQPSRYEGKAVTVREAQILGKPVIITNYATSSSQLRDGVDGMIVPMENERLSLIHI